AAGVGDGTSEAAAPTDGDAAGLATVEGEAAADAAGAAEALAGGVVGLAGAGGAVVGAAGVCAEGEQAAVKTSERHASGSARPNDGRERYMRGATSWCLERTVIPPSGATRAMSQRVAGPAIRNPRTRSIRAATTRLRRRTAARIAVVRGSHQSDDQYRGHPDGRR